MDLLKRHYLILLTLILFCIIKSNSLSLPYSWDELDVYSKAILGMLDKDLSVLPFSETSELTRGHPALFFIIYKWMFGLFGSSIFVGHLISLVISLLMLVSVYYISLDLKLFKTESRNVFFASASVFLLAFQPIFEIQSSLVLPEVLLAFWLLWSSFFFIKKQLGLYLLFSALAVLTKETAIILPATIGLMYFYKMVSAKYKLQYQDVLFVIAPILIMFLYFIIQNYLSGYYFFPLHMELISFNPVDILTKLILQFHKLILNNGRFFWLILIVLYIKYYKSNNGKSILDNSLIQFSISLLITTFVFFSLNYFMTRYIIFLFPILTMLIAYMVIELLQTSYRKQALFLVCSSLVVSLLFRHQFFHLYFEIDTDYSYFEHVELVEEAVAWVEPILVDGQVVSGNFPMIECFKDARQGYLPDRKLNFKLVSPNQKSDFYLHIENRFFPFAEMKQYKQPEADFKLLKEFRNRNSDIKIFVPK